jgi:CBS domain-containing protein
MSPRAAWRLEALGYLEVYDYVAGKSDWMAAGLPTEGDGAHGPRVSEVMERSVPTCEPGEPVAEVVARVGLSGEGLCVVVNDRSVVRGRIRLNRVEAADGRTTEEVMEPGPTTVRADADLAETTERMKRRGVSSLIVSTPDGVLLGVLHTESNKERHE